jgi:hypothetical protein
MPDSRSEIYRRDANRLRDAAAAADDAPMQCTLLEAAAELDMLADTIERAGKALDRPI